MLEGKVVAAVMSFYFRDQVLPYYGAADPQYNAYAPSNYMYFDLMRWAGSHGFVTFDFGRRRKIKADRSISRRTGGMETRDLPYEILLIRKAELPKLQPE